MQRASVCGGGDKQNGTAARKRFILQIKSKLPKAVGTSGNSKFLRRRKSVIREIKPGENVLFASGAAEYR